MQKLPLGTLIQDAIHQLEVGAGSKVLKWGLLALAMVTMIVAYNWRAYRNMSTLEAMDAAQLARNIATGKGYTTLFIRPLSINLLTNRNSEEMAALGKGQMPDPARLKGAHPDIANPPVYPIVLAALMKVLPFRYEIPGASADTNAKTDRKYFWNSGGRFWWYPPDFFIAVFNQLLLVATAVLTFLLARLLFDVRVAWLSAVLLLGAELFWRFSVSGLSTMLLVVIFMGLLFALALLERSVRENAGGSRGPLLLAAAAGFLVGIGGLTRYSFAVLIIPVVIFIILFAGQRRVLHVVAALLVFGAVFSPWVARNYSVSGKPFGTATYTVVEGSGAFPEHRLERSLSPNFGRFGFGHFWHKLLGNCRRIVGTELPKLGGTWTSAFFLVGLMLYFNSPAINRLRYFVLMSLLVLIVTQAIGRTQLSEDSPDINSENLIFLLSPVVIIYGVSLFFVLLDQMDLPLRELRFLIIGAFSVVMCLPMLLIFLPPPSYPVAYPPYYPPAIQQVCSWMKDKELMMSDIPWAVAWYGNRQCVWLTLNATRGPRDANSTEDFFCISDYMKPVQALYLTPQTMDSKFLSQWIRAGESSWGGFIFQAMRNELPASFPLRQMPTGFLPEQLYLSDWERWRKP